MRSRIKTIKGKGEPQFSIFLPCCVMQQELERFLILGGK